MIKAILFDLGNVLVRLNGQPFHPDWCQAPVAEVKQAFMAHPALYAYHCGDISETDFVDIMLGELPINTTHQAFVEHFRHWPDQLLPKAIEIVQSVKPDIKKAVFSNINDSHWPVAMNMGLAGQFDYYFASHRIGIAKPSPGLYLHALKDLGLASEQVLLVDDTLANVEMAKRLGLHAEQVVGTQALQEVLEAYQLVA